jgi:hypothetical protein
MKKLSLSIFLVIVSITSLWAQASIDDYYVDFAVPDITAFSILDINTSNVVRPGNVKEFAAGIQNYIDEKGNLKPGLALEFAPFRMLAKEKKDASLWRSLSSFKNLQISLGTAQGDSTNFLGAWGINWTPIDFTDPVESKTLQNYFSDFLAQSFQNSSDSIITQMVQKHRQQVIKFLLPRTTQSQRDHFMLFFGGNGRERVSRYDSLDIGTYILIMKDTISKELNVEGITLDSAQVISLSKLIEKDAVLAFREYHQEKNFIEDFEKEVKTQKKIFEEQNWNRLVVQIKTGAKYSSEDGAISDLSIVNWRIFGGIAGRVPGFSRGPLSSGKFARNSQVVYQLNYANYKSDVSPLTWEFSTGLRLLYGKSNKRFSGEVLYSQASVKGETQSTNEYIRYTIGGEMKVSEGLWLELAIGGQKFLQGDDSARVVPEFGIKYAIQKKSRF